MLSVARDLDGWQSTSRSASPSEANFESRRRVSNSNEIELRENHRQGDAMEPRDVRHNNSSSASVEQSDYKPVRRGVALSQEIHDEYLICKICLEEYKNPKSLDCMHSFCEECVESHALSESSYKKYSDYREFTCPLCRKRTQLPLGGVRKLPDNHLIIGLMKSIARRCPLTPIMTFVKCDVCHSSISYFRSTSKMNSTTSTAFDADSKDDANHGAARCLDCCKVLCARCSAIHRSTPVTRSHSVYDPDVVADILKDPNALACREHCNETVEYYCLDCRQCVCMLCAFDDQAVEPHVTHELVNFETAAKRHQSTLRELSAVAGTQTASLESELATLTSCADHVDSVRRQIRSTAESLRRQIDTEERAMLTRLDAMYGGNEPLHEGQAAAVVLKERLDRLVAVRRLADTVAERQGVELLLLHEEVEKRLRREQQLVLERRSKYGATPGGSSDVGVTDEIMCRRVEFVPGLVSFGRLFDPKDSTIESNDAKISVSGCCPTCQRRSPAQGDADACIVSAPAKLDKGVNTRAHALLHNGTRGRCAESGSRESFSSSDDRAVNAE